MSYYRTCERCGAALDPGEQCDCQQDEEKQEIQKIKPTQGRKEFAYGGNGRKTAVAI